MTMMIRETLQNQPNLLSITSVKILKIKTREFLPQSFSLSPSQIQIMIHFIESLFMSWFLKLIILKNIRNSITWESVRDYNRKRQTMNTKTLKWMKFWNGNLRNYKLGLVSFMTILKQKSTVIVKSRIKWKSLKKCTVHQIQKKRIERIFTRYKKVGLGTKNSLIKCNLMSIQLKEGIEILHVLILWSLWILKRLELAKMNLLGLIKMLLTNIWCMIT